MPKKSDTLPPALRHGGYATSRILPGEDPAKFEELHRTLRKEFRPNGPSEEAVAAQLAAVMWQIQNLGTYRIAKITKDRRKKFVNDAIERFLLEDNGSTITSFEFSQENDPELKPTIHRAEESVRKELGDNYVFVEMGRDVSLGRLRKELEVLDRLSGMVDRLLKQLLHIRGIKSLSTVT